MKLADRVAFITGGGRGIGREIALAFAREGARVVACDQNSAAAEALCRELVAAGHQAVPQAADVSRSADARRVVEATLAEFGQVDILVNNAGISPKKPFLEYTEEDWDRVLGVNLKGAFLFSRAVAEPMMARRYGRIVSLSSSAWRSGGVAAGAPYAASKAGVIGLTRSLAKALGPYGITVNAIAPGPTVTPLTEEWLPSRREALLAQIPLGRLGQPEDVAAAALFLASDEASYITGVCLDVNGGLVMG
ncbi:MAG: 3-oxoacyl-ACP reductase family protein [Nitrospinota bacterium]